VAQQLGIQATIVMPRHAPLTKIVNTRAYGADVILEGETYADAYAVARKHQQESGQVFIHAFDDELVMAGQGTIGLELLDQAPELDAVIAPIGGGGLIGGFRGLVLPSVAMTRDETGNRYVSLRVNPSERDNTVAILALDGSGDPLFGPARDLFENGADLADGDLPGSIELTAWTETFGAVRTDVPHLMDLSITGTEGASIHDGFDTGDYPGWEAYTGSFPYVKLARQLATNDGVRLSLLATLGRGFAGSQEIPNAVQLVLGDTLPGAHRLAVEVRVGLAALVWHDVDVGNRPSYETTPNTSPGVQGGGLPMSVSLDSTAASCCTSEAHRYNTGAKLIQVLDEPRLISGIPAQLTLSTEQRRFEAQIRFLDVWSDSGHTAQWTSMVSRGESVVLAADTEGLAFDTGELLAFEAEASLIGNFDSAPSEVRMWDRVVSKGTGSFRVGACLPNESRVVFGGARIRFGRPTFGRLVELNIGGVTGRQPGEFLFPISFDAGPNERIYVLDAGNARVQVFDHDGSYITQFGAEGTGTGEFDFGRGIDATDLAGSIAVDDDGFIYVADVGNQRIQKFAP